MSNNTIRALESYQERYPDSFYRREITMSAKYRRKLKRRRDKLRPRAAAMVSAQDAKARQAKESRIERLHAARDNRMARIAIARVNAAKIARQKVQAAEKQSIIGEFVSSMKESLDL